MKERLLTNTEPKDVFRYFEDLTFIPRESRNEKEVSDYLIAFAKEHGLEAYQDEYFNVLIRKPATPGYEDHPGVILQAHMDMVCEKNPGVEFDFARDPIQFVIEGDNIIARDTTLGADNGIGVAMSMAILADDSIKHPMLEFVCTTDEESGMLGIENFDFDQLRGSRVINLDSSEEGCIVAGCAGGPDVRIDLPVKWIDADKGKSYFDLSISELVGGHSGEDIHRGRANANKLLVRVLNKIGMNINYEMAYINGGLKSNAIPRNANAIIGIDPADEGKLKAVVDMYASLFSEEYRVNDPNIKLTCEKKNAPERVMDEESRKRITGFITFVETGIVRYNQDYPSFVETSTSLGVVNLEEDSAFMLITTRSSMASQYELLSENLRVLTDFLGGRYQDLSCCPAWEFGVDSEMRAKYAQIYKDMFGKDTETIILHAGVEPGEFSTHIDRELDMISLGPDNRFLHAPGEYVSISSTERVYNSVKALIEAL